MTDTMGLFPNEMGIQASELDSAPRRMWWTRERGTRRLLFGLAALAGLWFVAGQIQDHFLLQTRWNRLEADKTGLTLLGTLNSRESYDRNLMKIITANKASRVVLTEYGWKTIFDVRNGPLFEDRVGNDIEAALKQDDVVGYAMLTPFLRAVLEKQMGNAGAFKNVRDDMIIDIPKHTRTGTDVHVTLKSLLLKFENEVGQNTAEHTDIAEAGSGSGREKENNVTIPAETLLESCPVVLTGRQCTGAWLEEVEGSVLTPATYTVHLNLTPEGRSRFFQWSHDHTNENVVFVLNGQVVAAPRVSQTLNVSDFAISNVQDKKAAQSVVDFMSHQNDK